MCSFYLYHSFYFFFHTPEERNRLTYTNVSSLCVEVCVCVLWYGRFELVHIIYEIYDLNGIFVSIHLRQDEMNESIFGHCYIYCIQYIYIYFFVTK